MRKWNLLLALAVIAIATLPLIIVPQAKGGEALFSGSDGQAQELITAIRPDYQPWFTPFWEPPSQEIESLLFALQAAIGAGMIGFTCGHFHGRKSAKHPK